MQIQSVVQSIKKRSFMFMAMAAFGLPLVSWADSIVTVTDTGNGYVAEGGMGDAHNRKSATDKSYISCKITNEGGPSVFCGVRNAAGTLFTCGSTDPNLIANARAIHPASYVKVSAPVQQFGTCTDIAIIQSSSTTISVAP